jgi:hypothetical protein
VWVLRTLRTPGIAAAAATLGGLPMPAYAGNQQRKRKQVPVPELFLVFVDNKNPNPQLLQRFI